MRRSRTECSAASGAVAAEARNLVRRAAGDVVGRTVAAQVQQAARHLGYQPDDWRVREAWYGRAGSWSAAALNDLRRRGAAWQDRQRTQAASGLGCKSPTPAQRVEAIRQDLARLSQQVDELAAEISRPDA